MPDHGENQGVPFGARNPFEGRVPDWRWEDTVACDECLDTGFVLVERQAHNRTYIHGEICTECRRGLRMHLGREKAREKRKQRRQDWVEGRRNEKLPREERGFQQAAAKTETPEEELPF